MVKGQEFSRHVEYISEQNRQIISNLSIESRKEISVENFKYSIVCILKQDFPFRKALVNFQMTTDI